MPYIKKGQKDGLGREIHLGDVLRYIDETEHAHFGWHFICFSGDEADDLEIRDTCAHNVCMADIGELRVLRMDEKISLCEVREYLRKGVA